MIRVLLTTEAPLWLGFLAVFLLFPIYFGIWCPLRRVLRGRRP